MDTSELTSLRLDSEVLSPERYPDKAIPLNQRLIQLDPKNTAAYVRLARAYQALRQYAEAMAACQKALHLSPRNEVAQLRLRRITEEVECARRVENITSYNEAFRRGYDYKEQELIGEAIACFWRAVDLSATPRQAISSHMALASAYRSRKDPASLEHAMAQYEWVLNRNFSNLSARKGLGAVGYQLRSMNQGLWEHTWRRTDKRARAERDRQQESERTARRQQEQRQRKRAEQQKTAHHMLKKPGALAEALKVLKLEPPVTREQIRRAYRAQVQSLHPDHGGSHAEMVRLNAAYELARAAVSEEVGPVA